MANPTRISTSELTTLRMLEPTLTRRLSDVAPRGVQIWFTPSPIPSQRRWAVTFFMAHELQDSIGRANTLADALVIAFEGLEK